MTNKPQITDEAIIELADKIDQTLGSETYGGTIMDYVAIQAEQMTLIAKRLEELVEILKNKGV